MSDQQSSDAVADVYEVDSIKIRAEARKAARKVELAKKEAEEELKRHLMARALRARSRPAPVAAPSVWARIYSGFSFHQV